MRTFTFGVLASLGLLAGCETERGEANRAAENLRQEEQEARQEVGREVQEGREEVGEARQNLAQELRDAERSGEPVEFDAVVVSSDPDSLNLRLGSGETYTVDYAPGVKATRGTENLNLTDIPAGSTVHITYRYTDGKRMVEHVVVNEGGAMPGTEGQRPAQPGGTVPGGTPEEATPGGGTK